MTGPYSGPRSGACLVDTHPRLHAACTGQFQANSGNQETSALQKCWCSCHTEGTELHKQVLRARGAIRY